MRHCGVFDEEEGEGSLSDVSVSSSDPGETIALHQAGVPSTRPASEVGNSFFRSVTHRKGTRSLLALGPWIGFALLLLYHASHASVEYISTKRDLVIDLLDRDLYIKTTGAGLLDQEDVQWGQFLSDKVSQASLANCSRCLLGLHLQLLHSLTLGPFTLSVPAEAKAGQPFVINIQCDPEIIGQHACTPQYQIHLRGPTALTLPPNPALYKHEVQSGRTEITCLIAEAGHYEIWAFPENTDLRDCPEGIVYWTVRGSGREVLQVMPSGRRIRDSFRVCTAVDYQGPTEGRWVSLRHIKPSYQALPWVQSHSQASEVSLHDSTLPEYVYAPYQCKRSALDVAQSVANIPTVRHVAYVGDSILRSSYCGHLYPSFHQGAVNGTCAYSEDLHAYHFSAKEFEVPLTNAKQGRNSVRFSLRFFDSDADQWESRLGNIGHDLPVTHLITNIGMWFGEASDQDYVTNVARELELLASRFPPPLSIIWISTPSLSPGIFCHGLLKRKVTQKQGLLAKIALQKFQESHPLYQLAFVDGYKLTDNRPETSSEGRHWVIEGDVGSRSKRPLAGSADNAIFEWVWDIWRAQYAEESLIGTFH